MSITSWVDEFYKEPKKDMTDLEAIDQCLSKYEGLTKKNLEKHGVTLRLRSGTLANTLTDFGILGTTRCALCVKYFDSESWEKSCTTCPLSKIGQCCFNSKSAYQISFNTGKPGKMIKTLKLLKSQCSKRGKWKKPK